MNKPSLLIVAVLALALTAGAPGSHRAPQAPVAGGVKLLDVQTGTETLPGVLRPVDSATLGAALDAPVLEILVEEGQRVRGGEAIARLDDRVAAASLALAEQEAAQNARITRAQLLFEQASRIHRKTKAAFDRGASSEEELTRALTDLSLAAADLREATEAKRAAELRAEQARAQLERHVIRAPFDGVVLKIPVEVGALVQVGDPVAEVANADRLKVDLYLPATTALGVTLGDEYALHLHAPSDRVFWGTARHVEPRIEPTSGTVRVTFELAPPIGSVLAGTVVTVAQRLPTPEELAFARAIAPRHLAISTEDIATSGDPTPSGSSR
jgi:RND family efflux transporter MFP subunit